MILKGSQRGGGQDLAAHLMRLDDNEHVRVHELREFASDNLRGAFKEAEAISRGTKCRQYLFSLSLSPPESASVTEAEFEKAIDDAERRLGLDGQPRAIVFHEKEGRRHAHAVWSRIDAATMTARPMSFFKKKLVGLSRDLYLEHGWDMPRGIAREGMRDPRNFTLAEWQQAKRQGQDPRWLKAAVQSCWQASDSPAAFSRALEEHGCFMARGDRRGHVIIDHDGEVHSLPRVLGLKSKDVKARLDDGDALPSVEATRKALAERMTPAIKRHVAESRTKFQKSAASLAHAKMEMTHRHRDGRAKLDQDQTCTWDAETKARSARLPKGLRGLWHRITGQYQKVRAQNEAEAKASRERQAQERQQLIDRQREERARLQVEFKFLRKRQAEELLELRRELGRFFKFSRGLDPGPARKREMSLGLSLER
ncbi:relaxase/mobilization nuclease domain-containing protein [Methylobacterium radiotolerans]|uniref:relaxase/mobilization nuclease domain-containing protein n=1 Tax=Methylobacterium radiotolerans TaxID=31998 RepID=UPI0015F537EA|nr:relaxase [Methylobacterium radiotolerans]